MHVKKAYWLWLPAIISFKAFDNDVAANIITPVSTCADTILARAIRLMTILIFHKMDKEFLLFYAFRLE